MTSAGISARSVFPWADIAVLAVAVVWGASYPVAKSALAYAPVLLLIFYRFLATALIMAAIARRELTAAARRDLLAGAVLGGILFAIFLAETCGVALTTATNTALIISLCTIFTAFLEFGLKARLPPAGIVTGALVTVIGVAVLAGGPTPFGFATLGIGDLLVLGAAVLRAVMVVSTKHLMKGRALSSAALTAVQAGTVAALTLAVLLAQAGPESLLIAADGRFWGAVAFLSLFCTIGAFYVQNAAVRRTSPTRVSLLMGTEPLFGFAFAWAILSEPATPATLTGAGLIVGGTLFALASGRRP